MSTDRWIDKDVVNIHNGILLSHKKEWNNAIYSNMDWPRDYRTKWSKSERERQISYDNHLYVESKKIVKKELIYKTEMDSQTVRDLWLARGEGWGGEMDWEFVISRCKLVYTAHQTINMFNILG